jgi:hypothetical protein
VSTELFPSNGFFIVASLHSRYLAKGLHVTILILNFSEITWDSDLSELYSSDHEDGGSM